MLVTNGMSVLEIRKITVVNMMNRIQKQAAWDVAKFMLVVTTVPFIMIGILTYVPLVYIGFFACVLLMVYMIKMMYDIRVKQLEWAEKYDTQD